MSPPVEKRNVVTACAMEEQEPEVSRKNGLVKGPDICRMLKISSRTLRKYRESGLIPFFKVNSRVYRYDEVAVREALEHLRVN